MGELLLPDIPRLYTALAEWLGCLLYILPMRKRHKGVYFAGVLIIGLCLLGGINYLAGLVHPYFWIGWMGMAFTFMFAIIYASLKVCATDALFYTVRAFIAAEFAASFEWQIFSYFNMMGADRSKWSIVFLIVIYAAIFSILFLVERRHLPRSTALNVRFKELFSSVLICLSIFIMSNISFVYQNTPFSATNSHAIFYIRTLVDFAGFILLYAQLEIRREGDLRHELEAMDNLLQRQYSQYRISKENDEIISRKYHDLKHQIAIIRKETDPQKKEEYLQEMDNALKRHEAENRTGNHVLDTVLFGKALYCIENEIQLTCMADGSLIDFIEIMDICTIFGNALDNAIESVEQMDAPEKKIISMSVTAQNQFAVIRFENYYGHSDLVMDSGLPITTKQNAVYHGYGLKSIRSAVENYDGCLTINIQDNWFCLNILIPLV